MNLRKENMSAVAIEASLLLLSTLFHCSFFSSNIQAINSMFVVCLVGDANHRCTLLLLWWSPKHLHGVTHPLRFLRPRTELIFSAVKLASLSHQCVVHQHPSHFLSSDIIMMEMKQARHVSKHVNQDIFIMDNNYVCKPLF